MTNWDLDDNKVAYFRTAFPIASTEIKFYYADEMQEIAVQPDFRKFQCVCESHLDISACSYNCCEES